MVSSKLYAALDNHLWWLTYRWARHSHPNKSKKWIARRYFGRFNKFRNDRWVFGARDHVVNDRGDVAYLVKFSWTAIVRHQLVAGRASPDDPDLVDYWAARRRKVKPPLDDYNLRLLAKQDGRCPLCGDHLLVPDQPPQSPHEWERWWLSVVRRAIAADHLTHHGRGGTPDGNRTRLVHTSCHRSLRAAATQEPDVIVARDAHGACLSRGAGKARSPGSEGAPARKRAGATRQQETANDQLKTHLRGPGRVLRSRLPDLVHQEIWAYLIVHHAISALTAKASAAADLDPDRISFAQALRLIRRTATGTADIPPQDWTDRLPVHLALLALLLIPPRRERTCPRAVKRARHNSYRIKKPGEPASTRHRAPATINLRGLPRTA